MNAFIEELAERTDQIGPSTYALKCSNPCGADFVELGHCTAAAISVHRFWSEKTGRGRGGKVLRLICEIADRHGAEIVLKVLPFGPKPYPMSADALKAWYERHGFVGTTKKMVRKARKVQKPPGCALSMDLGVSGV